MIIILYDIIVLEPFMFLSASCDVVIVTVTVFIVLCDIMSLFLN